MPQGFINPQSDLAAIAHKAVVASWGKRAIDLAKAAGESVDAASLGHWLNQAEPAEARALRATDPDSRRQQYREAEAAAEEIALLEGIWRHKSVP